MHDVLPAPIRTRRGQDGSAASAAPWKAAAVRHESFSTPGPVTLDIRIPAGDIEIETDDAGETAVELQAHGRDTEELERDAEISMRPRGDGYEVRIEAGGKKRLH